MRSLIFSLSSPSCSALMLRRRTPNCFLGAIFPIQSSLLQNSSNAANFPCVRGAERPALRPARA